MSECKKYRVRETAGGDYAVEERTGDAWKPVLTLDGEGEAWEAKKGLETGVVSVGVEMFGPFCPVHDTDDERRM